MEAREWGAHGRGTHRTGGWGVASHQSCVWWLEIRNRIARGDCSLPKGYRHECVCAGGAQLLRVSLWGPHSLSVMYFMAPSSSDQVLHFTHFLLRSVLLYGLNVTSRRLWFRITTHSISHNNSLKIEKSQYFWPYDLISIIKQRWTDEDWFFDQLIIDPQ